MFRTLSEVKAANNAAGGKFFDKSHRESPVSRRIYPTEHGAIIVSSVARDDYRHWLVWWADSATGVITPAKGNITSDSAAHTFARDLARLDRWGNKRAKTLGEMTPQEKREVVQRAAARMEQELRASAGAISKIMDEAIEGS